MSTPLVPEPTPPPPCIILLGSRHANDFSNSVHAAILSPCRCTKFFFYLIFCPPLFILLITYICIICIFFLLLDCSHTHTHHTPIIASRTQGSKASRPSLPARASLVVGWRRKRPLTSSSLFERTRRGLARRAGRWRRKLRSWLILPACPPWNPNHNSISVEHWLFLSSIRERQNHLFEWLIGWLILIDWLND